MTKKASHWLKQIDRILNNDERFVFDKFPNGKKILKGIKKNVEQQGTITAEQIQAIQNIKWGKN